MEEECPFCWSRNIKRIGSHPKDRCSAMTARLMECGDCEKWYWAERREEVAALFMNCQTAILQPHCCYKDLREVMLSAEPCQLKRRLGEFNHLCAECPNANFLPGPEASPPPIRYPIHDYGFPTARSIEL